MGKAKPVNKDQASCRLPGSCCRPTLLLNLHVLSLLYKMGRMKWRFLITFEFPLFQGEFILPICSVASTWMCQPTLLADEDGAYRNSLFIPLSVSQCVTCDIYLIPCPAPACLACGCSSARSLNSWPSHWDSTTESIAETILQSLKEMYSVQLFGLHWVFWGV